MLFYVFDLVDSHWVLTTYRHVSKSSWLQLSFCRHVECKPKPRRIRLGLSSNLRGTCQAVAAESSGGARACSPASSLRGPRLVRCRRRGCNAVNTQTRYLQIIYASLSTYKPDNNLCLLYVHKDTLESALCRPPDKSSGGPSFLHLQTDLQDWTFRHLITNFQKLKIISLE